ncbi:hypothetical protein HDV00_004005 [Rhizophlyctis rosea]|nr:hypothetical protein HDV00_004005 [Rhizophlyctis rosea]
MSHFVVNGEGYNGVAVSEERPELSACCWLSMPNDAVLAAGGTDTTIHILSIAKSEELKQLSGHAGPILDMVSHPTDVNLVLSLSKDGTIRLWHLGAEKALAIYKQKATALALHPFGTSFLTANTDGSVSDWDIPEDVLNLSADEARTVPVENIVEGVKVAGPSRLHGSSYVDSIRYVAENVLSKSVDGKILLWDPETSQVIRKFTVKGNENNRCRFDVTPDNQFFCIGNENGGVFIYNLTSGKLVSELRHKRSTKAIRCCAFTRNCRQIVFVGEDSFIWRFDYISEATLNRWKGVEQ